MKIFSYSKINTALNKIAKDESGVTAVEYALIAAGIAIAIVVVVGTLGNAISATLFLLRSALGRYLPAVAKPFKCPLMSEGQTAMMASTYPPQSQTSVCSAISRASSTSMPK